MTARRLVAGLLAAFTLMAIAIPSAGAVGGSGPPSRLRLCAMDQRHFVVGADHIHYVIRNDFFSRASDRECILNSKLGPNFTVTKSLARSRTSEAAAFPEIFRGCVWGIPCAHTGFPVRAANAGRVSVTWLTDTGHASGFWNTALDIWFFRRDYPSGQAGGAELMIWDKTTFARPPASRRIVSIDGTRWWFQHWRPCNAKFGKCWNYIQFRRVQGTDGYRGLGLGPFVRMAIAMHLISPRWYMESVAAGFEIWKRGAGLRTRYFRVRL